MTASNDKEHAQREDLDHRPENAGNVGEQNKQANEKGEQPRPREQPDGTAEEGPQ